MAEQKQAGLPEIGPGHLDAIAERCEKAISDMHRPIVQNKTAVFANIIAIQSAGPLSVGLPLDAETYEHIAFTSMSPAPDLFRGRIAGYYSSSYKGRIYIPSLGRTLPFELLDPARTNQALKLVTDSLTINTLDPTNTEEGFLRVSAYLLTSRARVLKRLLIVSATAIG